MTLPPWRHHRSMLSKWLPSRARTVRIVPATERSVSDASQKPATGGSGKTEPQKAADPRPSVAYRTRGEPAQRPAAALRQSPVRPRASQNGPASSSRPFKRAHAAQPAVIKAHSPAPPKGSRLGDRPPHRWWQPPPLIAALQGARGAARTPARKGSAAQHCSGAKPARQQHRQPVGTEPPLRRRLLQRWVHARRVGRVPPHPHGKAARWQQWWGRKQWRAPRHAVRAASGQHGSRLMVCTADSRSIQRVT